jgi:hypothetical protein
LPNKSPTSTAQILNGAQQTVAGALPNQWTLTSTRQASSRSSGTDSSLTITSPSGEEATFAIKVMRSPSAQTLLVAVDRLNRTPAVAERTALPLVAAAYLGPRPIEWLTERGVNYVDTTGNLRLSAQRPGLFVNVMGATRNPWSEGRPLRSLRGRGAGRAVRALVDFRAPFGVRDLGSRAGVSPATLSRTIDLLEEDALVTRNARGGVEELDWSGTIRRWSRDYELRRSNTASAYLEPRGLSAVTAKLKKADWPYAVTSSLAAQGFAPISPARTAVLYVENTREIADCLGLRPVDEGGNVLLIEPYDPVVFERTSVREDLVTASPSQVAVDLLTGPGREPSEGEELLLWMKGNEAAWRT